MGAPGVAVAFCGSRARLWFGGVTGAAGAAFAGASFARCSRSFVTPRYGGIRARAPIPNVGDVPVARRKRSAPAKQRGERC